MWDNHEFSWQGWQSIQKAGKARPGQSIKVAANQAWWEYLPSRCKKVSGPSLESFDPPAVTDVAIEKWDENGLGDEPNNLAAINSLIGYRSYPLRQAPRPHHHRSAQLSQRRSVQRPVAREARRRRVHRHGAGSLDAGARRWPRVQRRQSAGRSQLRRCACPQSAEGTHRRRRSSARRRKPGSRISCASRPRRGRSGAIRKARSTGERSAEPAPGIDQGNLAEGHLCSHEPPRLRNGLYRARRDLRPRPRCEDHRLRHRLGRPPQLLGGLRDLAAAAGQVRAGRLELRRRIAVERRHHGSPRAQLSEGPIRCARCSSPIAPARRSRTGPTTCC